MCIDFVIDITTSNLLSLSFFLSFSLPPSLSSLPLFLSFSMDFSCEEDNVESDTDEEMASGKQPREARKERGELE
jgi:hypothetical protein